MPEHANIAATRNRITPDKLREIMAECNTHNLRTFLTAFGEAGLTAGHTLRVAEYELTLLAVEGCIQRHDLLVPAAAKGCDQ